MRWIDGHCDVLSKLWREPGLSFYEDGPKLDVTLPRIREAGVGMQVFAIFVPPDVSRAHSWETALAQVDCFYEGVVKDERLVFPVLDRNDVEQLGMDGRLGAFLSLEGADAIQGELLHLRLLHRLGVRMVGLTWNHANEVADGIEEERGGGLTRFGRLFVREMGRFGQFLDVSHLSVRGFWEVMDQTDVPVLASHSNCRTLCPHPRNLDDDQIRALIERDGLIGLTFVPKFLHSDPDQVRLNDLFRHLDHLLDLGASRQIVFGSDFDGIDQKVPGLANTKDLSYLEERLAERYPEHLRIGWQRDNFRRFLLKHW
ncbi:dipeptidase [Desmospora profundinema]|uniref:Membrane dipeptidase n=1 Tax=Desmospora profundinema TaxID=1571184 RepID=A0ABU1IHL8_9BACL|nr:dipeptidase [Desmospora profundinema]MDR6224265.1 membrane dipeptidase [Desmospora profundinema]